MTGVQKTYTDMQDYNIVRQFSRVLTMPLRALVSFLPGDAPMFIYTKLLRLKPLRKAANFILRKLIPKELELPEGKLLLNQNDPVVSGALSLGAYEVFFTEIFRQHLQEKSTVVDIGANLGYYTLIASAHAKNVIAFEPEKQNAELLKSTIELNKRNNITLIEKGLGEKDELLPLALHPDNKGKHTLLGIKEPGVQNVPIPVTTLDAALAPLGSPKIDLIKADIEGWEAKALRGAQKTIQTSQPIIMFEFGPERIRAAGDDPLQMLDELKKCDYELFVIDEHRDTLAPLQPEKLIEVLPMPDSYVNVLAKPKK